jgi:transposase-like protein
MSGQRHSRAWWREIIAKFISSGMSRFEFAARHGVHPESVRQWRREFRNEAPTVGALVRVELAEPAPAAAPAVFEASVGRAELRFAVGTDTAYVGALVAAIARAAQPC